MPKFKITVSRVIEEEYAKYIFADSFDEAQDLADEMDEDSDWHDTAEWEVKTTSYGCSHAEQCQGEYTTFMITEYQKGAFDVDVTVDNVEFRCFFKRTDTDGPIPYEFLEMTEEVRDLDAYRRSDDCLMRYYFSSYKDAKSAVMEFILKRGSNG